MEGYIKGLAVQELQAILNDKTLDDEAAVKSVDLSLEDPITLEILGKNRQSPAEQILKALCFVLIPLGIGIIPTLFLVGKRLHDSGGTSINFFKPLSENLYEDSKKMTYHVNRSPESFSDVVSEEDKPDNYPMNIANRVIVKGNNKDLDGNVNIEDNLMKNSFKPDLYLR